MGKRVRPKVKTRPWQPFEIQFLKAAGELIAEGQQPSYKAIATKTGVDGERVKIIDRTICERLKAKSTRQAVELARHQGIING